MLNTLPPLYGLSREEQHNVYKPPPRRNDTGVLKPESRHLVEQAQAAIATRQKEEYRRKERAYAAAAKVTRPSPPRSDGREEQRAAARVVDTAAPVVDIASSIEASLD
eukprot:2559670-Prymnesium_polylepis.1